MIRSRRTDPIFGGFPIMSGKTDSWGKWNVFRIYMSIIHIVNAIWACTRACRIVIPSNYGIIGRIIIYATRMRKIPKSPIWLSVAALFPLFFTPSAFAFDPGCYAERAEFSPLKQGITPMLTEYRTDLTFIQDGKTLQYRSKSVKHNVYPIAYSLRSLPVGSK